MKFTKEPRTAILYVRITELNRAYLRSLAVTARAKTGARVSEAEVLNIILDSHREQERKDARRVRKRAAKRN